METEQLYSSFLRFPLVCTDSRQVIQNSIFFALSGPSFNGNSFAESALEGGCTYAVIDDPAYKKDDRYIVVDNALKALQELARHHRRQLNATFIAITGSNGKTTSKELIRDVLATTYKTIATKGNLNNHIGVPLTLLSIPSDTQFAVIEMGASHQGDIQELVEIAEPDYGLITNIGKAHLEGMGGIEGVIKTKTELYDYLRLQGGKVFINTMHAVFKEKSAGMQTIPFGEEAEDSIVGRYLGTEPYVRFKWKKQGDHRSWDELPEVQSQLIGKYNYENLLAAAAIGAWFGVSETAVNEALSCYSPDNNRSQVIKSGAYHLIMDAYNANPSSMKAALENFDKMQADYKVVVLGQMNELGESSAYEHQQITQLALELGFDKIVLVGEPYAPFAQGEKIVFYPNTEKLIERSSEEFGQGGLILIKGSRSNRLERLKESILA